MSDAMVSESREASVDSDLEQSRTLTLTRREILASDVVQLELSSPDGSPLPPWEPGAHIDLLLPGDSVRQYSLCSDPRNRTSWQVAILREAEGRGGSIYVHDQLEIGATVEVRGPRNNFPLEPAGNYVFVAGGIGVTPMIPMILAAEERGIPWELLYGGRSRSSMSYVDHLESTYGDKVSVRPQDEFGLLDLDGLLGTVRVGTTIYCCGPEPLLQAIETATGNWPSGSLHIERFSPKLLGAPALPGSFEVELSISDQVVTVPPDKSILEVLEEQGVPVVASCQEGMCGSCETVVLDGTPEHRDSILSPAEQEANETMMVCVSRSRGPRLVLEI